jgi:hypothetical protein
MMITGSLLLVCIVFHFYDFYFVKLNFVEGAYMVKTEDFVFPGDAKAEQLPDSKEYRNHGKYRP